ncbi:hypothetical protein ACFL0K_03250 [Patescibacteria group bacterium]
MINGTNKKTTIWIILILLAVIGGYTFFTNTTSPLEEPPLADGEYDTFAQCVYESGLRVYGSATCSFCKKQKELFGVSAAYIKEIECDPRNPNSQTPLCIEKNITHTPTWIHENEDGSEIFRFEPGVISLETISEQSGCELVKDVVETGVETPVETTTE